MTDDTHPRTAPVHPSHPQSLPPLPYLSQPARAIDSDGGSQQERNHNPNINLPRLPPPAEVSRNARNTTQPAADTSPKHPYRKRKVSTVAPVHDLSSLTHKETDRASSIANPHPLRTNTSPQPSQRPPVTGRDPPPLPSQPAPQKFVTLDNDIYVEGSTEAIPNPSSAPLHPDHNIAGKRRRPVRDPISKTDLLEENRSLRIQIERLENRLRKSEATCARQKKDIDLKDSLLTKYRVQLVGLFEDGDGDLFTVNRTKYAQDSPNTHKGAPKIRDPASKRNSKVEDESMSNSQEDEFSTSSAAPSNSLGYGMEKSEERHQSEKEPCSRSDRTIRKHRRTRAPAWTAAEERIFMDAYAKHGCRWKLIQEELPRRSRRQIQSHGSYLIRQGKLEKKNSRPWQRRKPRQGVSGFVVKNAEAEVDAVDGSDAE